MRKCCEHCVNSYLQNQELEREEKQENECLACRETIIFYTRIYCIQAERKDVTS